MVNTHSYEQISITELFIQEVMKTRVLWYLITILITNRILLLKKKKKKKPETVRFELLLVTQGYGEHASLCYFTDSKLKANYTFY